MITSNFKRTWECLFLSEVEALYKFTSTNYSCLPEQLFLKSFDFTVQKDPKTLGLIFIVLMHLRFIILLE